MTLGTSAGSETWPEPEPPFPGWVLLFAAVALAGVLVSLGGGSRGPGTIGAAQPAPVSSNLLVAEGCLSCHDLGPPPPGQPARAPAVEGIVATAAARIADPGYDGAATTPREYLRESVVNHCTYVVPGFDCTAVEVHGNWMTPTQVDEVVEALARLQGATP